MPINRLTEQGRRRQDPSFANGSLPHNLARPIDSSQQTSMQASITSLTPLQGASLIVSHALFTKLTISLSLRVFQFLEPNAKKREFFESNVFVQQFRSAQANEVEYAAILTALLLFFSTQDVDISLATTLVVMGQIGYVWFRTVFGYPQILTISMALIRYGGTALLAMALHKTAF